MPKKTTYYKLNQYEPEDDFRREDFNADNTSLDRILHGKAEAEELKGMITTGVYIGDGVTDRDISLGFRPRAVLTMSNDGATRISGTNWGGLFLDGHPMLNQDDAEIMKVTADGFSIHHTSYGALNIKTITYYYIAIR